MTLIDLTSAVPFGSLTKGGGLAAIVDGNSISNGYVEETVGHAGVTLPSPKRIEKVEVVSADNGFDASGLTTEISLQLFGKNGAAPASGIDGVLLGQVKFQDQNTRRTIALDCTDQSTKYAHVWVRISTGVWVVISEIRLFEAEAPVQEPDPEVLGAGSHVFMKSCNQKVALVKGGVEIREFRTRIRVDTPRLVLLDFHSDVTHDTDQMFHGIAVGYSFWISTRSGATKAALEACDFMRIPHAVGGGNVSERNPQHYGDKAIPSSVLLQPGWHEFSVIANGHTDAPGAPDGILKVLVEGGMGINCLRVTVLP